MRRYNDLIRLVLLSVLVPLTWVFFLEWRPGQLTSAYDATVHFLTPLKELIENRGSSDAMLFRIGLAGGVKLYELYGEITLPVLKALAWLPLGLSPVTAYVAHLFLLQVVWAFLALKLSECLVSAFGAREQGVAFETGSAWLAAFAPVVAWRVFHGHINLLLGTLFGLAFVSLVAAAWASRLTRTTMVVGFFALWHGFESSGQQNIVNSAVFGSPILVGLLFDLRRSTPDRANALKRAFSGPLLIALAALFVSLPKLAAIASNALSGESAREVGAQAMVYSHLVATARDWLSSLPWSHSILPGDRHELVLHEANYPIGPLALLIALLPLGGLRFAAIGFGISVLGVLVLSMNLAPLSSVLLALLPPLAEFRVPARAMLVPLSLLAAVVPAAMALRFAPARKWVTGMAFVAALAMFFLPATAREPVGWGLAAALLFTRARNLVPAAAAVLFFGLLSVAAFKERRVGYFPSAHLLDKPKEARLALVSQQPELENALVRVALKPQLTGYGLNSAYAIGVSSIEGYWIVSRRLAELYAALEGRPFDRGLVNLEVPPEARSFKALQTLYNIRYVASLEQGQLKVSAAAPTFGAAWFTGALRAVPSYGELVRSMQAEIGVNRERLRESALVLEKDAPQGFAADCAKATVERAHADRSGQRMELSVRVPPGAGPCALAVSVSYTELLKARNKNGTPLQTFALYGSLLGVVVPANAREIEIEARR